MTRPDEMATFLAEAALALRAATTGPAARAAERCIALWQGREGKISTTLPQRPPVCDWLAPAFAAAANGPRARLAFAFAGVADRLVWVPSTRSGGAADFALRNANAGLVGQQGYEQRDDLWIGATVMAPDTAYPLHSHPPEEVYLALSPGEWWNEAMDWTDPGLNGSVYNPPGIGHRMRSGAAPFLALWFLPL
ncbi:dimethylsulfonioproprionate lyase family protein [Fuscibacter oryzae]|uniref:Transcriptional regulator n=1 Tax=Fuscibacter oryzae TaxID=2803939 RepID=A0A8J7SVN2_9RHOB|nr:dimethylsulfonioproprionate lyase family protein [Fuscibacter oryzae]MBL4928846.1 transcriptional regulator [Fuscibacter oryzae]